MDNESKQNALHADWKAPESQDALPERKAVDDREAASAESIDSSTVYTNKTYGYEITIHILSKLQRIQLKVMQP